MIAVIVPRFGYTTEIFLERHVRGIAELNPVVFTLNQSENINDIPIVLISLNNWVVKVISNQLFKISYFWDVKVNKRSRIWKATSIGAGTKLLNELKKRKIKLILIHFANLATSFIPYFEKIKLPLVVVCHGSDIHSVDGNKPYLKKLKRVFERADSILCVSKYIQEKVIAYGCDPKKAEVFYLGADIPGYCKNKRENPNRIRYVMTGRLVPIKGHDFLIRAFAKVHSVKKETELVLIGDGPELRNLGKLVEQLGLSKAVRFLGGLENKKVYEILADSDIYVQASLNEALGIAVVEAMAAGLPVIATDVGGIPEIVRNGLTGNLVQKGDVDGLADAMLRLSKSSKKRREMGNEGRRFVESHFNVVKQNKECVKKLLSIIQERS